MQHSTFMGRGCPLLVKTQVYLHLEYWYSNDLNKSNFCFLLFFLQLVRSGCLVSILVHFKFEDAKQHFTKGTDGNSGTGMDMTDMA
mmetsp:Transcript_14594/g.32173  ORF Transcript_14594/g.32173 Transcript_14594/m.32173 type:complete len:86 (+) Transcript_14594:1166-1423(+)